MYGSELRTGKFGTFRRPKRDIRAISCAAALVAVLASASCTPFRSSGSSDGTKQPGTQQSGTQPTSAELPGTDGLPPATSKVTSGSGRAGASTAPVKPGKLPPAAARGPAPSPHPLSGITYSSGSEGMRKKVAALAYQNRQVVNAVTVRSVNRSGRRFGEIGILSLDKKYVKSAIFRAQLVTAIVSGIADPRARVSWPTGMPGLAVAVGKLNVAAFYQNRKIVVIAATSSIGEVTRLAMSYRRSAI
jgi:hypothetical protein